VSISIARGEIFALLRPSGCASPPWAHAAGFGDASAAGIYWKVRKFQLRPYERPINMISSPTRCFPTYRDGKRRVD